jgi:hypothetical protein
MPVPPHGNDQRHDRCNNRYGQKSLPDSGALYCGTIIMVIHRANFLISAAWIIGTACQRP